MLLLLLLLLVYYYDFHYFIEGLFFIFHYFSFLGREGLFFLGELFFDQKNWDVSFSGAGLVFLVSRQTWARWTGLIQFLRHKNKRNTYIVREHHVIVLPVNHVSILCMELCVSGGSHTQYTYMIGSGAQLCGAPGPCMYFSKNNQGNNM